MSTATEANKALALRLLNRRPQRIGRLAGALGQHIERAPAAHIMQD